VRPTIVPNVKIAVLDHEKLTRDFIVNVMTYSVNREVMAFEDGDGLEAYLQAGGTVHILFSEAQLPGKNAFELLEHVKAAHPEIRFVTMSANPADEATASALGADAFLAKPFTLQNLFDIVQRFIVDDES
jgi:two-component system, OmpR family, alkaline phosphatase synthesis response regulator PhoP